MLVDDEETIAVYKQANKRSETANRERERSNARGVMYERYIHVRWKVRRRRRRRRESDSLFEEAYDECTNIHVGYGSSDINFAKNINQIFRRFWFFKHTHAYNVCVFVINAC